MAWTEITRRHYRREGLRYGSDTTDAEWFVMEPLLPPASALGRPRATDMRTVIDAILYIASTGCQWRQLPKDFPPYSTVQGYFYAWSRGGIFASLNVQHHARPEFGRSQSGWPISAQWRGCRRFDISNCRPRCLLSSAVCGLPAACR